MIQEGTHLWRDSEDYLKPKSIVYDDIVDDKDFSKLKQQKRLERLSQEGAGASSGSPQYDFEKGKKRSHDKVSDSMLALRSGKLDKADVQEIQKHIASELQEDLSKSEREQAEKDQKEVSRQRQEHLDSITGFKPESNPQSV